MNPTEHDIESILRKAPAPSPPRSLESQLRASFSAEPSVHARNNRAVQRAPGNRGWRRWLAVLLPAGAAAAISAGAFVQHLHQRDLENELHVLREGTERTVLEPAGSNSVPVAPAQSGQEIERLRALVKTLEASVAVLDRTRAENERLRAMIDARRRALSPEAQPVADAQDRAHSIQCVNNLKQLGLAVRIFATDNKNLLPSDILSMTNEMGTPKILVCPADHAHVPATQWGTFNSENLSYEYLLAGVPNVVADVEPARVMFRCPIHGHIALVDGSVHMALAKDHPEELNWRNGGLYFGGAATDGTPAPTLPKPLALRYGLIPQNGPEGGTATSTPPTLQMNAELMRRYGLIQVEVSTNDAPADPAPNP